MAATYSLPFAESIPISIQIVVLGVILLIGNWAYSVITADKPFPGFPMISLEEKGLSPKKSYIYHGIETILKGAETCSGPFQVMTGTGPKLVLQNKFADELKHNPNLSFNEAFQKEFFPGYPGFESFEEGLKGDGTLIAETVRTKLTQSLGLITNDLVEESTLAIHNIFGDDPEWHSVVIKEEVLDLVSQLSARVFLGKPLCRNKRWLQISKNFTVDSFIAAFLMRALPPLLRPVLHWVMPHNIKIRRAYKDATKIILPEIKRRQEITRKAIEAGGKAPKIADTIGWMYEVARGREFDWVALQLSLTTAAIHTTSESITRALLDVCEHPEIVQPLRDEIIEVIGKEGWSKQALYKLRYMDSFLNESMRLGAMTITTMNRLVKSPVQLSDGTILPKDARIMVVTSLWDPAVYPDAQTFKADRFLRMREKPGQENSHQHVATSVEHMGFGHGQHACPGRFFASNEMKIALAHLLLKYDFKSTIEGEKLERQEFEGNMSTKQGSKIFIRRRKEEISVDLPEGTETFA